MSEILEQNKETLKYYLLNDKAVTPGFLANNLQISQEDLEEVINEVKLENIASSGDDLLKALEDSSDFASFQSSITDLKNYRNALRTMEDQPGYPNTTVIPLDPKEYPTNTGLVRSLYVGVYYDDSEGPLIGLTPTTSNVTTLAETGGTVYTSVYDGWFKAPQTGMYTFSIRSDDSSIFYISGIEASSHKGMHAIEDLVTATDSDVYLIAGNYHPVKIYYGNNAGVGQLTLSFNNSTTGTITDLSSYWYRE